MALAISARNGCSRASAQEMRRRGSMASSCSSKSTPVSDSPGHHLDSSSAGHTGKSVFQSCKAVTPGHTSSLGVPSMLQHSHNTGYVMDRRVSEFTHLYRNILKSSSISESPGNRGRLVTISAKMVPTAQMSTGKAYVLQPNKISGARYHKVTTSCVKGRIGGTNARANPKSASFSLPSLETSMF
jgi:hypothetical protein